MSVYGFPFIIFSIRDSIKYRRTKAENTQKKAYDALKQELETIEAKHDKQVKALTVEHNRKIVALTIERNRAVDELEKHKANLNALLSSNLTAMPWLAGMMADYLTYDFEVEAKKLEWGHNVQREKKIASVRAIRADAQSVLKKPKSLLIN